MTLGQRAKVTLTPDLTFGAAGVPNAIPPNSPVILDIELFEVK